MKEPVHHPPTSVRDTPPIAVRSLHESSSVSADRHERRAPFLASDRSIVVARGDRVGARIKVVKVSNITIDCDDVLRVARFWSAVLERPLDARSGEYFASIGGTDPERTEPAWYFARVPEPKRAKNRVHLDLTTPDPDAVERLVALGAT